MAASKGSPKRGGRTKGTPNKVTADIRAVMLKHANAVTPELIRLATKATSEAARLKAIEIIYDRAYGKPKQGVELSGLDGGPIDHSIIVKFVRPAPPASGS